MSGATTNSFSVAKISFKGCLNIDTYTFPITQSRSEIIRGNDRSAFINEAVLHYNKQFMQLEKAAMPIACSDLNNFLDCQAIGKIVGTTFAFQVQCDFE